MSEPEFRQTIFSRGDWEQAPEKFRYPVRVHYLATLDKIKPEEWIRKDHFFISIVDTRDFTLIKKGYFLTHLRGDYVLKVRSWVMNGMM